MWLKIQFAIKSWSSRWQDQAKINMWRSPSSTSGRFLVGGNKQQPGTSSHPDLNPARTRPSNPCISNHATLPPAHPAQDGNSTLNTGQQQSAQGHPNPPRPIQPPNKKNPKVSVPWAPRQPLCSLCVRTGFQQNVSCSFFVGVAPLANPWLLVGELSNATCAPRASASLPPAPARNTCDPSERSNKWEREVIFGLLHMVKWDKLQLSDVSNSLSTHVMGWHCANYQESSKNFVANIKWLKIEKGNKSFLESVVSCSDQQLSFWSNFAKTFADAGSMLCELESS